MAVIFDDITILLMILVCTTMLISFIIIFMLFFKNCEEYEEDTSEDQRNKIYNSNPMESNIPFASIHEMLQNHQDIENENEFKWI